MIRMQICQNFFSYNIRCLDSQLCMWTWYSTICRSRLHVYLAPPPHMYIHNYTFEGVGLKYKYKLLASYSIVQHGPVRVHSSVAHWYGTRCTVSLSSQLGCKVGYPQIQLDLLVLKLASSSSKTDGWAVGCRQLDWFFAISSMDISYQ